MNILDDPQTTIERIDLIQNKTLLKKTYLDFYKRIKSEVKKAPKGKVVELGSGAGFIKKVIPSAVTTDIMKLSNVDIAHVDAERLPFKINSLSAIVMLNVFHHINNPEKALREFERTLKKDGKIVMIEPANSWFGRFMNQNFHHEEFNPKSDWKLKKKGPLSGGNGAIPWIVFERDRKIFEKRFPNLKIQSIKYHTPLMYILSGGFSKPQLVPSYFYVFVKFIENLISPLNEHLGMFATIVIKKTSKQSSTLKI